LRNFLSIAWNDFSLEAEKSFRSYGIFSGKAMDTDEIVEALTYNMGEGISGVAKEKFEVFIRSEDFVKMSSYGKLLNFIHMIGNV